MKRVSSLMVIVWALAGCVQSLPAGDDDVAPPDGAPQGDSPPGADAPPIPSDLDQFIEQHLAENKMSGLSAAVIRHGEVVWAKGYGEANRESHEPVTTEHLFEIASVSKTVTATAVMQLYEQGMYSLDDDIQDYVGFPVRNPHYPGTPITIREVMTHTSSIQDTYVSDDLTAVGYDCAVSLGDFVAGYFTPGGAYYDATGNWHSDYGPGQGWDYSNIAVSMLGYLVEHVSGEPFDQYTETHILQPLGMNASVWRIAELDGREADPYIFENFNYQPVPQIGYPDYPAGKLYTSPSQLGIFLSMFIGGGEVNGVRILQESTVAEMRRIQFPSVEPTQGLIWYYKQDDHLFVGEPPGYTRLGHNGSDYGYAAEMFFDTTNDVGVILLMNGEWKNDNTGVELIENRLFNEGPNF